MPIQTSIFTPGGSQDQWPLVQNRSDTFQFILSQAPDSVLLDKDNWLLDRGITRVGVEAGTLSLPLTTSLLPVHPNPSRGSFRIEYALAEKGRVRLSFYNLSGQLVRELVDVVQPPGRYSAFWDGRDQEAHRLPSGVYFYRLQTKTFTDTKKAVVVR
jgi:flagellar hook assembly protein FlgD